MSPALADPDAYAEVYAQHLPLIKSIVRRSGCPYRLLDDVTSMVVTGIVASDGLSRYDPSQASLRTYLASYVSMSARSILARIRLQEARQAVLEWDFDKPDQEQSPEAYEAFLGRLLALCLDEDSKAFVLVAAGCATYAKARQELVAQGWESNRIRRTVKSTRAALRSCQER